MLAALAFGGVLWAAGTAPPPVAPGPKPAAAGAADEPVPLLPKDRTGVWRSVVISQNGNRIVRYAIRFKSGTELVWDEHFRQPGVDHRVGVRYKYALTADGKLELNAIASMTDDGTEFDFGDGIAPPPAVYTILPLNRDASAFQLVQEDARGRRILDAVFRKEKEAKALPADPLVPECLTKIDRTIKKEPRYVNKPKYLLVAFGPEAKFKVWVVVDGDVVYIDRNGNGDLTEEGERCSPANTQKNVVRVASAIVDYKLKDAERTHLNVDWFHDGPRTSAYVWLYDGDGFSLRQGAGFNLLNLATTPDRAGVVHLDSQVVTLRASLTISAVESQWRYATPDANREAAVSFEVGTPGVGPGHGEYAAGSFAYFNHSSEWAAPLLKGGDPVAVYEFTPLDPTEGVKKVTVKLTERIGLACQCAFGGKITVPDGVKTGLEAAKVTLSFPNCPWGKVEPVTYSVDVIPKK